MQLQPRNAPVCPLAQIHAAGHERVRHREYAHEVQHAIHAKRGAVCLRGAPRLRRALEDAGHDGHQEERDAEAASVACPVFVGVHDVGTSRAKGEPQGMREERGCARGGRGERDWKQET